MSVVNAFENFFHRGVNVSTGFPAVDLLKRQKTKVSSLILKDKNAVVFRSPLCVPASKNASDWWLSYWISQLKNNGSSVANGSSPAGFSSAHLLLFSPGGLM